MLKKIYWFVLLLLLSAGAVYWYNYTKESRTQANMAITAIPTNAAFIIESNQAKDIWKKIAQTNIIWEELITTATFFKLDKQLHYIDSVINTNEKASQVFNNNPLYISAHSSGAHTYHFLFTFGLPDVRTKSDIESFISSLNGKKATISKQYDGVPIRTIFTPNNDSINYAFVDGLVLICETQTLIESAIRQLKSGISLTTDSQINKILATAGKNVDLNFYVNYKNLKSVVNKMGSTKLLNKIPLIEDFANFSAWDVRVKPNALTFSGFTEPNGHEKGFLSVFYRQKPQEIRLTKILPSSTSLMLVWGISSMNDFRHDYQEYNKTKKLFQRIDEQINAINKKYAIDIEQAMFKGVNHEIGLVITECFSNDFSDNTFAVFHLEDAAQTQQLLRQTADSINKKEKLKPDTLYYKGHLIEQLRLKNIISKFLGPVYNGIENTYFCPLDEYMIYANSKEALKSFIDNYENKTTLENNANYEDFSENISSESNIYIYSSIARSNHIYTSLLNNDLKKDYDDHKELIHKFDALGLQYSINKKLFYSNAYISYNPSKKKQNITLWETKLDAPLKGKPHVLLNHINKTKEVFVQDTANKVYLISNTGKILWTKQLDEEIISPVTQIDIYKNNKLQLLFNTPSAIIVLDRNGVFVEGFPLKLPAKATNGISVFDYNNTRNYRIFVACESKKLYCYNAQGKEIGGFKFDKTENIVRQPLQYFKVGSKEHLILMDEKSKLYILNRQGEIRIPMKEHLQNCKTFFVETGVNYAKTFILGADSLGNIIKISLDNRKEKNQLEGLETITSFDFQDVSGSDKINEYLFVSGNKLKIYSQNKSLLFEHEFEEDIKSPVEIFTFPNKEVKIGVSSIATGELFLFNNDGSIYKGFPLEGNSLFDIADINNDGKLNVITGSNYNSIYAYQLGVGEVN